MSGCNSVRRIARAPAQFPIPQSKKADEANLDGSGNQCYAFDGVGASGVSRMKDKAEKKVSFRETIRVAWKPYKRLYTYVGPYKWRFILGLALGFLFGVVIDCFPLILKTL